jgi:hypothetical protein
VRRRGPPPGVRVWTRARSAAVDSRAASPTQRRDPKSSVLPHEPLTQNGGSNLHRGGLVPTAGGPVRGMRQTHRWRSRRWNPEAQARVEWTQDGRAPAR